MSQLTFYYAAMSAGKTARLLQSAYNYEESGLKVLCVSYLNDTRSGEGIIASRVGISRKADFSFGDESDILDIISSYEKVSCVFVDEAQFLTRSEVVSLTRVVDELGITVNCYGLRTDFKGEPFCGSKYLFSWADRLIEIESISSDDNNAIMNIRVDSNGLRTSDGAVISIGYNYRSISRKNSDYRYYDF